MQLPLQPAGVNLPAQPQDPPTLADIVNPKPCQDLVDRAVASQETNKPMVNDAAKAGMYKTNVILAHSAEVAPPWFQSAIAPIQIMAAQTRNHQLHDGGMVGFFSIVPFLDGSMPTQPPHNLPPLINVEAIRALGEEETNAYIVGYGIGNVGPVPAQKDEIMRKVGLPI